MQKGTILTGLRVEKIIFGGSGLARLPDGKTVILSGGAIPESVVSARVIRVKKNYVEAQLADVEKPSPYEEALPAHYQVYGGCKWLPIRYEKQLEWKADQVREAFHALRDRMPDAVFHPIVPCENTVGYRNKLEFSFGKYISAQEGVHDEFRFGFHKSGSFDKIVDCTYCVLGDETANAIFRRVDAWARASGLPTYDAKTQEGCFRHLVIRRARYTGETMVVLSLRTSDRSWTTEAQTRAREFLRNLPAEFPQIASVYLLENNGKADIVTGDYRLVAGRESIRETLSGLEFHIRPESFFQTNTVQAERLYDVALGFAPEAGNTALDLYGGTGTIGCLLARRFRHVDSIEIVASASADARENAIRNNIANFEAHNESAESFLKRYRKEGKNADFLVVDPPRDGMHPDAARTLVEFHAKSIVYVSCNPATLARDVAIILDSGLYRVTDVVPVDMFPHTHHIETVARLELIKNTP